jgi:tRNA (adenine22-N1)-methyltransferase
MTERLKIIFDNIPNCSVFADVGCDHGYIAKAMLVSGKAEKVIASDISAKCLEKAEEILENEIKNGTATSVVSNGFEKIPFCDVALIAGMGGEEITTIINSAKSLPNTLVIQPMKNCDKARLCAVKAGYSVQKDFVFKSANKFYDLIVLVKGEDKLSQEEIEFGRTNLKEPNSAFIERLKREIEKLEKYSQKQGLSPDAKREMLDRMEKLKKYVKA